MSVITTGNFPKALMPGVHKWYGADYKKHDPIWTRCFEALTSKRQYEEEVEIVGTGLLSTKAQGAAITYDTAQQGATSRYTQVTYASGIIVTMEELKFNQYPEQLAFRRAGMLSRSTYETEETLAAQVFNRAFNSSFTGGDGKEMIATDHPTSAGAQSNELTTAADLSEASVEDLDVQVSDSVDARGLRYANKSRMLMVPNTGKFDAVRITQSAQQNDTANNALNAIKSLNLFPDGVLVNPYLTDTDAWFIKTDTMDGTKRFTAMAPDITQDNDFDTKNFRASVLMMLALGWTNWRGWFGSAGA